MRSSPREIAEQIAVAVALAHKSDAELAADVLGRLAMEPLPRSPELEKAIEALLALIPVLAAEDRQQATTH